MLSVIGRNARIIHAYICPDEQRLKVHYSQLFDFSHYTSAQADLFIRWLMSDPILPEKPISEGDILSQVDSTPSQQSCSHDCVPKLGATLDEAEEPDDGSKGDKAPQVMVVETTRGPRSPRCDRDFLHASVEMSNTSMVMVA